MKEPATTTMLPPQDNELDLNIVCHEAAAAATTATTKRKPKKRNKYEKRREKARRARQAAASNNNNAQDAAPLTNQEHQRHGNGVSSIEALMKKEKETVVLGTSFVQEVNEEKEISDAVVPSSTLSIPSEIKNPAVSTTDVTANTTSNNNSRNGRVNLENEQERARYMAEFHARPLEMDRRSGATAKFHPSRESTHLFEQQQPPINNGNDSHDNPWKNSCLGLHSRIAAYLEKQYSRPTVIQSRAIQLLQNNCQDNVFIQSETGSGKTLAYLVPILQSLAIDKVSGEVKNKQDRKVAGTQCLILVPTRELALQTAETTELLLRNTFSSFLVSGCLSGGEKRKSEKGRIRKGLTILIATPGRLLDHLQKTKCLLESLRIQHLVLDEADRLLDMGLGGQVKQVVELVRTHNQSSKPSWRTIMVSATVTNRVQELANDILVGKKESTWKWVRGVTNNKSEKANSSVEGQGDDDALTDSTPRQLAQLHMTVSAKLRLTTLVAFLVQRVVNKERTVVFMSTCDSVDYHLSLFQAMDNIISNDAEESSSGIFGKACPVFKLHGNVPHAERQSILKKFQKSKPALLLATDVAARGLNLPLDWILQYDAPCEVSDYIHRAGRAARAGRAGHSLLFVLPSEKPFLDVLKLRGLDNMTALSLASTLNSAASTCQEALELQGSLSPNRLGEAFCFELQKRLENVVINDDAKHQEEQKALAKKRKRSAAKPQKSSGPLLEAAIKAYLSFVRAYPTKEKSVRHIFSARAMHLGHVARSFALKEPPKSIAGKRRDNVGSEKKRNASLAFDKDKSKTTKPQRLPDDYVDTKKARSLLIARAQKLQDGGMDAF